MKFNGIVNNLISLVKKDKYFKEIEVVEAYPCREVATRLNRCIVVFGIDEVKMESYQVDDNARSGSVSIFADIFVPIRRSSRKAGEIFSKICCCLNIYNVISVSAERITVDKNTQTYVLKSKITFNDEIIFRSEEDE